MNAQTMNRRNRRNAVAEGETQTLEPQAQGEEGGNVTEEATGQEAETPVAPKHDIPSETVNRVKAAPLNGLDLLKLAAPTSRMAEKSKLLSSTAQRLAQLVDMQGEQEEAEGEALEITNSVAFDFYNGMANGVISLEEVTDILGNQFGFAKKGARKEKAATIAERSKTPFGYGDKIRQRTQRAVKAAAYVSDPSTGDSFFKSLPVETVEPLLDRLDEGELSIWTFYDLLQKERTTARQNSGDGPVPLFLDARKLAKLVGSMTEAGSLDAVAEREDVGAIIVAYSALSDAITSIVDGLMARDDADDIVQEVQNAPALEIA